MGADKGYILLYSGFVQLPLCPWLCFLSLCFYSIYFPTGVRAVSVEMGNAASSLHTGFMQLPLCVYTRTPVTPL